MFLNLRMVIFCASTLLLWQFSPTEASDPTTNFTEHPFTETITTTQHPFNKTTTPTKHPFTGATTPTVQTFTGSEFTLMVSKLDYLQYKLDDMEITLKKRDEQLAKNLSKLENSFDTLQLAIAQLDQNVGHNLTSLQGHVRKVLVQQTTGANQDQTRMKIAKRVQKQILSKNAQLLLAKQDSRRKGTLSSCKEAPVNSSGVYLLQGNENDTPFEALCENTGCGGGWLVIHYRFNGSLDFYCTWSEYRNGFGSAHEEFWIGLERLHQLTSQKSYELMVEMKDFAGTYKFAHYKEFAIGNETEQYALKKLGTYTGTAGDSLEYHQGAKFTTKDRDNDSKFTNCAVDYEGAWWYQYCHESNLNGRYMNNDNPKSMCWKTYNMNYQGLAYARMMIREL